jgi:hypothetical protein
MENISLFEPDFRNTFLGGNLECTSCNTKFSAGFHETVHLHDSFSKNIRNVQDIAGKVKDKIMKAHHEKVSDCKNFQMFSRNKKMMLVTMDSCKEIYVEGNMCLLSKPKFNQQLN